MISPCGGCDSPKLAHILAVFEMLSGIFTMVKTAWWFHVFRKGNSSLSRSEMPETTEPNQALNRSRAYTQHHSEDIESSNVSDSNGFSHDATANNTLWTITGMTMGTLNFVLGGFFLVALTQVNYILLVIWCIVFPTYYFLDCISFSSLLKHFTTKDRFDRLKSQYILSTIISFVFSSYILWVGISVIHWCSCRRDQANCRFSRDYCHSFHLNFSITGISGTFNDNNEGLQLLSLVTDQSSARGLEHRGNIMDDELYLTIS